MLKFFGSERVNLSENLMKSAEKHLYRTFSSFRANLTKKKLFLIRCEILGLPDNTLTANHKHHFSNRKNLRLAGQIKLSKKSSSFCGVFLSFFESKLNFQCSKKNEPQKSSSSEVIYSERCAYLNA